MRRVWRQTPFSVAYFVFGGGAILAFAFVSYVCNPPASTGFVRSFIGHTTYVNSVSFSPDGRYLATGSDDKTAHLWEVASGRVLRAFKGHTNWVTSAVFSPDGRRLATGSLDKTARIWEVTGD